MITFEEFSKVDLKVAKIISAAQVEGSEKLLQLKVSLGSEERQIIAGIGKRYTPEALIGQEVVIVANLEPRILMGLESQGMLLAANHEGPVFLKPEKEVLPGASIQ